MIDVELLRLRYEILNISLEDLASEIELPFSVLKNEAAGWSQWWPDDSALTKSTTIVTTSPIVPSQDDPLDPDDNDTLLSPLEEGANQYLANTALRLRVFNLAKEVLFVNRYASLESEMISRATSLVKEVQTAQDIRHISSVFKDLVAKSTASTSLSLGKGDDGMPTVIIRDLSGRS